MLLWKTLFQRPVNASYWAKLRKFRSQIRVVMKMLSSIKKIQLKILLTGIVLALSIVHGADTGALPHIILIFTLFLIVILSALNFKEALLTKNIFRSENFLGIVVLWSTLALPFLWLYGISLGLLMSNKTEYVFRNFSGMVFYLILPLLFILKPKINHILLVVVLTSIFQVAITWYMGFNNILLINLMALSGISDLRMFYNAGTIIVFPLIAIVFAKLIYSRSTFSGSEIKLNFGRGISALLFAFLSLAVLVPSASEGFILAWLILILLIYLLFLFNSFKNLKITDAGLYLLLLGLFLMTLVAYYFGQMLLYSFGPYEPSNKIRAEQADYLIAEFTFAGAGLGAVLKSGFTRGEVGFGFELTYLNLIHKFGVFSVVLFLSYISTVLMAINKIISQKDLIGSFAALGMMSYLILGAANPVLISTTAVILHCFAVYILLYKICPVYESTTGKETLQKKPQKFVGYTPNVLL